MALTYGFYNALEVNGEFDRTYDAVQMSQIFDGIVNDGVYASVGNHFAVSAVSGLNISVGTGRAWFNHTWSYNDAIILFNNGEVQSGDQLHDRIDAVVLEVDSRIANRINTIKVLTGTPSSNPQKPTLETGQTAGLWQHPLAYITVPAGASSIDQSNIENAIGVDPLTPYVTGIIQVSSVSELVAQWEQTFDNWFEALSGVIGYEPAQNFVALYQLINNVNDSTSGEIIDTFFEINSWQSGSGSATYRFQFSWVTDTSYQEILPAIGMTEAERKAWERLNIYDNGQGTGYFDVVHYGSTPTVRIPIRILHRDKYVMPSQSEIEP